MQVLYRDPKTRKFKFKIDILDDLWYLHNLIDKDDLVFALGYRKEEQARDKLRAERRTRVPVWLGIRVEHLEFHEFSDRLRVRGKIEASPKNEYRGYHTFNLEVGANVTIIKPKWYAHHLALVDEALRASRRPIIVFVAIEYDTATIALLRHYGIHEQATISVHGYGKQYSTGRPMAHDEKGKHEFYRDVITNLRRIIESTKPLVILGPGFAKDDFYRFGKEYAPALFSRTALLSTAQGGLRGIHEALAKGVPAKIIHESKVAEETQAVEQLLIELAKNGACAYGEVEVNNALDIGAVATLMVTTSFAKAHRADELIERARATRAKTILISTSHEAGKKLDALGGVGALLRYKPRAEPPSGSMVG